jgi:hypothetical protein
MISKQELNERINLADDISDNLFNWKITGDRKYFDKVKSLRQKRNLLIKRNFHRDNDKIGSESDIARTYGLSRAGYRSVIENKKKIDKAAKYRNYFAASYTMGIPGKVGGGRAR